MHELSRAQEALLNWFMERPNEVVTHYALEYDRVADECFRREGIESPANPGKTARELRKQGYLCTKQRGTYSFDPSHDIASAKLEWKRAQVNRELKGILRSTIDLQELLMVPNLVGAAENLRIGKLIMGIKELFAEHDQAKRNEGQ